MAILFGISVAGSGARAQVIVGPILLDPRWAEDEMFPRSPWDEPVESGPFVPDGSAQIAFVGYVSNQSMEVLDSRWYVDELDVDPCGTVVQFWAGDAGVTGGAVPPGATLLSEIDGMRDGGMFFTPPVTPEDRGLLVVFDSSASECATGLFSTCAPADCVGPFSGLKVTASEIRVPLPAPYVPPATGTVVEELAATGLSTIGEYVEGYDELFYINQPGALAISVHLGRFDVESCYGQLGFLRMEPDFRLTPLAVFQLGQDLEGEWLPEFEGDSLVMFVGRANPECDGDPEFGCARAPACGELLDGVEVDALRVRREGEDSPTGPPGEFVLVEGIESDHPYAPGELETWTYSSPGAEGISLFVGEFDVEPCYGRLEIRATVDGAEVRDVFDGGDFEGPFWTPEYFTDTLELTFDAADPACMGGPEFDCPSAPACGTRAWGGFAVDFGFVRDGDLAPAPMEVTTVEELSGMGTPESVPFSWTNRFFVTEPEADRMALRIDAFEVEGASVTVTFSDGAGQTQTITGVDAPLAGFETREFETNTVFVTVDVLGESFATSEVPRSDVVQLSSVVRQEGHGFADLVRDALLAEGASHREANDARKAVRRIVDETARRDFKEASTIGFATVEILGGKLTPFDPVGSRGLPEYLQALDERVLIVGSTTSLDGVTLRIGGAKIIRWVPPYEPVTRMPEMGRLPSLSVDGLALAQRVASSSDVIAWRIVRSWDGVPVEESTFGPVRIIDDPYLTSYDGQPVRRGAAVVHFAIDETYDVSYAAVPVRRTIPEEEYADWVPALPFAGDPAPPDPPGVSVDPELQAVADEAPDEWVDVMLEIDSLPVLELDRLAYQRCPPTLCTDEQIYQARRAIIEERKAEAEQVSARVIEWLESIGGYSGGYHWGFGLVQGRAQAGAILDPAGRPSSVSGLHLDTPDMVPGRNGPETLQCLGTGDFHPDLTEGFFPYTGDIGNPTRGNHRALRVGVIDDRIAPRHDTFVVSRYGEPPCLEPEERGVGGDCNRIRATIDCDRRPLVSSRGILVAACDGASPESTAEWDHGLNVTSIIASGRYPPDDGLARMGEAPDADVYFAHIGLAHVPGSSLVAAGEWLLEHDVDVVNVSFWWEAEDCRDVRASVRRKALWLLYYASVDVVSIAGNAGNAATCTATLPGIASSTICVGELNRWGACPGSIDSASGRGSGDAGWPAQVDLATFSSRTFMALPGSNGFRADTDFGGGGTSFAAPHVTGAIVLWKHWAIARGFGHLANTPGFIASAMLAMGDPYEAVGGDTFYTSPPLILPDGTVSLHEMSNITGAGRFHLRNPENNRVFYLHQFSDVLREGEQTDIRTPLTWEERLNGDRLRHVTWFHSKTYMETRRNDITAEVELVSLSVMRDGETGFLQQSPQRVDWKARVNLDWPYLPDTDAFMSRITDAGPYAGDRPVYSTILIEDEDRRNSWDQGHTWLEVFDARWWGTRRGTAPPPLTVLIDGEPEAELSERSQYSNTPATFRIELPVGTNEAIFVDLGVREAGFGGHEATEHVRLARDRTYNLFVFGDELTARPFEIWLEEEPVLPEVNDSFHVRFVNGIPGITADLWHRRNECSPQGWCHSGELLRAMGWRRPYGEAGEFVAELDRESIPEEELFSAFVGIANPFLQTPFETDGRQIFPGDIYTVVLVADHDRPTGLFFGGGKLLFFRHRRAP